MANTDNIEIYDANAQMLAEYYDRITTEEALPFLTKILQSDKEEAGTVLDIGSGAGRDAFWFADHGWNVDAIDGSVNLLTEARKRHPHDNIDYMQDTAPDFTNSKAKRKSYDLLVMSAFLFHFDAEKRNVVLKNCTNMMSENALIHMTLRCGPIFEGKNLYLVPKEEIENFSIRNGLSFKHHAHTPDNMGRDEITWDHISLWRGSRWDHASEIFA